MLNREFYDTVTNSVKWSTFAEISAKIATPIINMILARLLSPNEFGVIATVNMVVSFADVFTDAGFQKYLIQHHFKSQEELQRNANVAFWTNLSISMLIWIFLSTFSDQIANAVGNPGLGHVIIVAGLSLICTSFTSIQMAIYKKQFNYKSLFHVRVAGMLVPLFITIPLAILGAGYWSVIIGTLTTELLTAIILTWRSTWKPKVYFNYICLKRMFAFSMWILLESILLWSTTNIDIFFIGKHFSNYQLGLYKSSISMVNGLFNIIVAATSSVLLSALSAARCSENDYWNLFFKFQQTVSILIIPLGVGVFVYRDLATYIILGSQWGDASLLIGLYALVNALTILTGQYISIIFTAKGLPKVAALSQFLQLIELLLLLKIGLRGSFNTLIVCRCIARLLYGVINLCLAKLYLKLPLSCTLYNLFPASISALLMGTIAIILLHNRTSIIWELLTIAIDIIFYFGMIYICPQTRHVFKDARKMFVK